MRGLQLLRYIGNPTGRTLIMGDRDGFAGLVVLCLHRVLRFGLQVN